MGKFPVLLSIPHGGNKTPAEIRDKLCITEHDIFWDIDPFTHDIYDLNNHVIEVIKTNIARTFVDVNRSTSQMPPRIPDGLIKSVTSFKKPIYCKGMFPDGGLISTLIKKYYEPYQKKIETALQCKEIRLGLDCHSMLAEGPPIARDRGKRRPLICLGNGRARLDINECHNLVQTKPHAGECHRQVHRQL